MKWARQVNAVPSDAIVQLEGKDYIVVSQGGVAQTSYSFRLVQVVKGMGQEGYTAIVLPQDIDPKSLSIVVKNAYTVLSALRNAEDEE